MNSEGNDVTINLTSNCKAVNDHDDCTDDRNNSIIDILTHIEILSTPVFVIENEQQQHPGVTGNGMDNSANLVIHTSPMSSLKITLDQ
jgi:hypothetical protein